MMNLPKIYDASFFEEWGRGHRDYIHSAQTISQVLYDYFKPRRLVDLGCGCGVYSDALGRLGTEVCSLDGVRPPEATAYPLAYHLQDLTVPFSNVWGDFDVALCLEVAEHIPPELCDVFLKNIIQFSDCLVLSCAPPGQGGHHHVNEQPKRYWVDRLARQGFAYSRKRTGELQKRFEQKRPPYLWMCHHISVYEKEKSGFINRHGLPLMGPEDRAGDPRPPRQ